MRRKGLSPSSRPLKRGIRPATVASASRLRLGPDANVVVVSRLRLADDEPVALEHAVLRIDAAPALLVPTSRPDRSTPRSSAPA